MDFLQGKKTYIVAFLVGAVTVAHSLGYLDDNSYGVLLGMLNAMGLSTLAAKGNRIDNKVR